MRYEDHVSPGQLEARADKTIRAMPNSVISAGQWAATRTVQRNPVPTRVCSWMMIASAPLGWQDPVGKVRDLMRQGQLGMGWLEASRE